MFRLEQPEIKISKNFQIKTNMSMSVSTQTDTQNYNPVCSCIKRTGYRFVFYLHVQGGQLSTSYMYDHCTLFRAVWVAFFWLASVSIWMNLKIFIPAALYGTLLNKMTLVFYVYTEKKKEMFCLKFMQVKT